MAFIPPILGRVKPPLLIGTLCGALILASGCEAIYTSWYLRQFDIPDIAADAGTWRDAPKIRNVDVQREAVRELCRKEIGEEYTLLTAMNLRTGGIRRFMCTEPSKELVTKVEEEVEQYLASLPRPITPIVKTIEIKEGFDKENPPDAKVLEAEEEEEEKGG